MSATASQITSFWSVCSTVCSSAEQRKHQTSCHWPFWGEFTGDRWIPSRRTSNADNIPIWWCHHGIYGRYVYRIDHYSHIDNIWKFVEYNGFMSKPPAVCPLPPAACCTPPAAHSKIGWGHVNLKGTVSIDLKFATYICNDNVLILLISHVKQQNFIV